MLKPMQPSRELAAWRERFLRATLIVACILGLAVIIPSILASTPLYAAIYVSIYLVVLLVTILPAPYQLRAITLILLLVGSAVSGLINTGIDGDARLFMLAAVAMASLLYNWMAGAYVSMLAAALYIFFGWLYLNGNATLPSTQPAPTFVNWFVQSNVMLLLAMMIANGVRLWQSEFEKSINRTQGLLSELSNERSNLEERVNERTRSLDKRTAQLRAVADVGKSITSFRNLSELLQQATYLIQENFGYYHVGIFLLDEHKEYAILTATNSEGGRRMLEKGHQLKVGETGIVGFVAENLRARIALDVGADAVFFNNPDLPETRSEMALPLVAAGQILGVLDVQSTESQAFTDDDIATVQILAEQLAVAIQNTNLYTETEKALDAARVAYGEMTREAWSKILRSQPRIGYLSTPPVTVKTSTDTLEASLARAIDSGDLILSGDGLTISVPIKIRGQVIGAIRLKKPEIAEAWTQDETNLAIALSDQLSGALESARLYRESQQRAVRESMVSDISARLSATTKMEAILRETVQELGEAIGDASITFQLLDHHNGRKALDRLDGGA